MAGGETNPEVVFLRPAGDAPLQAEAWQWAMVELGVDFAFDDEWHWPATLPQRLDGVKAVLVDEASWEDYQKGAEGPRLRAFADAGGLVFKVCFSKEWSPSFENSVRSDLEMVLASAGVQVENPQLRRRLQSRSFRTLLDERRDFFLGQIGDFERKEQPWADPHAFGILLPLETFHQLEPGYGWDRLLRRHVEALLSRSWPPPRVLSNVSGMAALVRLGRATGDPRFLRFAREQMRHVADRFPRRFGVPVNPPGHGNLPRTETLSMISPSAVAAGLASNEPDLVQLGLDIVETVRRYCYLPAARLWAHGGMPGWRAPAIWCRGQGWAMAGLAGVLQELPPSHPAFPVIRSYLQEACDGLERTQDAEGLWRNVMDEPASRADLTGSALFLCHLSQARSAGWVEGPALDRMLRRAFLAIKGRFWRLRACSGCIGTSVGKTRQFYLERPHSCGHAKASLHALAAYVLAYHED